jgi:transposase
MDLLEGCVKRLLPEGTCLQVKHLEVTSEEVILVVTSNQLEERCPLCGEVTSRVHSRYERTLQDLPWGCLRVRLRLQVRRFFCSQAACPRPIFTERLPAVTAASARRTTRLRDVLLEIGWGKGGRSWGSPLPEAGHADLCRDTPVATSARWSQ